MDCPSLCPDCGTDDHGYPIFCPACQAALSDEITAALRQAVADHNGPCIRCCRERPTFEGLLCHACVAALWLEEKEDEDEA
jgi:hypothetical protein